MAASSFGFGFFLTTNFNFMKRRISSSPEDSDSSYEAEAPVTSNATSRRGSDDSRTSTESEMVPKPKKKRHRKHLSCEPCRVRKVKCDRQTQCSNCTLYGQQCSWREAAPTKTSDADTIRQLRDEIVRLRQLITNLTSIIPSPKPLPSSSPPPLPDLEPSCSTSAKSGNQQQWPSLESNPRSFSSPLSHFPTLQSPPLNDVGSQFFATQHTISSAPSYFAPRHQHDPLLDIPIHQYSQLDLHQMVEASFAPMMMHADDINVGRMGEMFAGTFAAEGSFPGNLWAHSS